MMKTIEVTEFATPGKKTSIAISEIQDISSQPYGFGDGSVITTAKKVYLVTEKPHVLIDKQNAVRFAHAQ
ncbi:hypothetical protein [Paenibacillus sp. MMO-58]|uniref:hypothetical protein n=1 Tax=Paenibacillus sp. MMO-58 TaxID=3081290 RepID=UPI003019521F